MIFYLHHTHTLIMHLFVKFHHTDTFIMDLRLMIMLYTDLFSLEKVQTTHIVIIQMSNYTLLT